MVPWSVLGRATVPDGGELRLMRRGGEYSIVLGQNELMNSRLGGSEKALGTLACSRIADRPRQHVLIGGLGMGFTLRAVLAGLGADARVIVAELVPEVVEWARGPMAEFFGRSLSDSRVAMREIDVADLIRSRRSAFDAILLDVDNGPEGLSRPGNDRLYDSEGLRLARRALRPGGVLAIWSAAADRGFPERLRKPGFDVEEVRVRATTKGRGARHVIWLASPRGT